MAVTKSRLDRIEREAREKQEVIKNLKLIQLTDEEYEQIEYLHSFLKGAWRVLEPSREFQDSDHLHLLSECLEAVVAGELQKLLINIAPRSLKSTLASVCFPGWDWLKKPWRRGLFLSYSGLLANDLSDTRRSLVSSGWYQRLARGSIPGGIRLSSGRAQAGQLTKNRISEFINNHRGMMVGRGFDGSVTGTAAGDIIVCLPGEIEILTNYGSIPIAALIEALQSEALQWRTVTAATYNHDGETIEYQPIEGTEVSAGKPLSEIRFMDGAKLLCTDEHPIYIEGKGYTQASLVKLGDVAIKPCSRSLVVSVTRSDQQVKKVYNIRTQNRNYFANGILVHNCDDPNNPTTVESDKVRGRTNKRFRDYVIGRRNDPKTTPVVVLQQRTDGEDVSGTVIDEIDEGDWTIIKLPTKAPQYFIIPFPRSDRVFVREKGEFLQPDRHGEKEDREARKTLGSYLYAARHDQDPAPLQGGLLSLDKFRRYELPPLKAEWIVQSWDTASKKGEVNCPWSCLTFAVFEAEFYIIHSIIDRMTYPEGKRRAFGHAIAFNPSVILIEDKSTGSSLLQDFAEGVEVAPSRYRKFNCLPVTPCGDKLTRIAIESAAIDAGRVWLPNPNPWNAQWLSDLENSFAKFPKTAIKDPVDSLSQFLSWSRTLEREDEIEGQEVSLPRSPYR
jgi:predicted phage terminase large subunit-like protein